MKRSEIALVVVLSASIVCACSMVWVKLKSLGLTNIAATTTESTTEIVRSKLT